MPRVWWYWDGVDETGWNLENGEVSPLAHRLVSSLELLLSSAVVSSSDSVCGVSWSLRRLVFNSLMFLGGVVRSMLVSWTVEMSEKGSVSKESLMWVSVSGRSGELAMGTRLLHSWVNSVDSGGRPGVVLWRLLFGIGVW